MICEKVEKSDIATIDKKKYLVPADLTVGQFVYVIRKRIKLSQEQALWVFVEKEEGGKKTQVLPPTRYAYAKERLPNMCSNTMAAVYHEYKDKDQFLYITYSGENVFGSSLDA